ncbi:hypothetical protein KL942_002759 [Ogataea angusta]|uniref:Uncharacterized protein n=1 Tax=Pichia angusta TaxID=870730 RepID=A0AAN6I632_PICAN|nr:uncharacterized protein KL928_003140 [Ogataea angusta]KAG7818139.1 hypothetical protein KL928_003140 [Ogataea angusta]KAG7829048.1 hypothetical protein KL920_002841 [Ogataea angusta]KAG7834153.1 hypothetical protein KL943_003449 [Ogataea angusta]KAG7839960.1 hypothetical protein KL942_002759 [Ogataea angusta]KAG7842553.1 hypothetical protein KL941_005217 [Ogataea angusta]
MDRGGKRMPLSEITGKLGLNRRPHRVLKPNQLRIQPSKSANRSINVASLTRSYLHKETQTRTKSSIDEITRQISLRHRSSDEESATAVRSGTFSGILTDQLNDYLTNIHSANAVLGYDQPISKERLPTVTISRINEVSPQLRLVEIDQDKVVALAAIIVGIKS